MINDVLPDDLLNADEAAAYVGAAKATMQGWRWKRTGPPFYTVRSRVYYSRAELNEYITRTSRRTPAAS